MLRRSLGLLAGGLLTIALAAPAFAGAVSSPATVTVRIEGLTETVVPRTSITTTDTDIVLDGVPAHSCSGFSGAGALEQATAGNWTGPWSDAYQYSVATIKGVNYPFGAAYTGKYWSLYLNGYAASSGICGINLQQGDSLLIAAVNDSDANSVLDLSGVPAKVAPGTPLTVGVTRFATSYGPAPDYLTENITEDASGVTVAGGGISATTGPNGKAALTFTARGPVGIRASKSGEIRSATETVCVTDGADGFCGTTKPGDPVPAPAPAVAASAPDVVAAVGSAGGSIGEQQHFKRGKSPRELSGTVDGEASGIKEIRVRLTRRNGKLCERYDGARERWVKMKRCGAENGTFFSVGDRTPWTYLLPQALTKGRYVFDTQVVDRAGNVTRGATRGKPGEARNRVVFHVD